MNMNFVTNQLRKLIVQLEQRKKDAKEAGQHVLDHVDELYYDGKIAAFDETLKLLSELEDSLPV